MSPACPSPGHPYQRARLGQHQRWQVCSPTTTVVSCSTESNGPPLTKLLTTSRRIRPGGTSTSTNCPGRSRHSPKRCPHHHNLSPCHWLPRLSTTIPRTTPHVPEDDKGPIRRQPHGAIARHRHISHRVGMPSRAEKVVMVSVPPPRAAGSPFLCRRPHAALRSHRQGQDDITAESPLSGQMQGIARQFAAHFDAPQPTPRCLTHSRPCQSFARLKTRSPLTKGLPNSSTNETPQNRTLRGLCFEQRLCQCLKKLF